MIQQCGKVNSCLSLDCGLRKTQCGRAKTKKESIGRNWNKNRTNSKERKELHTRETPKTKWVLEQKAACGWSKTNPVGQMILLLQLYLHFLLRMDLNSCIAKYFKCRNTRHFKLHKHEMLRFKSTLKDSSCDLRGGSNGTQIQVWGLEWGKASWTWGVTALQNKHTKRQLQAPNICSVFWQHHPVGFVPEVVRHYHSTFCSVLWVKVS